MGWNSAIDTVVTTVAAVSGINYCSRAALIDPDRLVKIPRWPKALVHDLGGQLDPFSGEIYDRMFGVTLVVMKPRGTDGSEASKLLATLSDLVVTALTHTRIGSSISIIMDSQEIAEAVNSNELYMKTLIFTMDTVS